MRDYIDLGRFPENDLEEELHYAPPTQTDEDNCNNTGDPLEGEELHIEANKSKEEPPGEIVKKINVRVEYDMDFGDDTELEIAALDQMPKQMLRRRLQHPDKLKQYLDLFYYPQTKDGHEIDWIRWFFEYCLTHILHRARRLDYPTIDFHPDYLENMERDILDFLEREDPTNPAVVLKFLAVMQQYYKQNN